jgi:hypothetical protein
MRKYKAYEREQLGGVDPPIRIGQQKNINLHLYKPCREDLLLRSPLAFPGYTEYHGNRVVYLENDLPEVEPSKEKKRTAKTLKAAFKESARRDRDLEVRESEALGIGTRLLTKRQKPLRRSDGRASRIWEAALHREHPGVLDKMSRGKWCGLPGKQKRPEGVYATFRDKESGQTFQTGAERFARPKHFLLFGDWDLPLETWTQRHQGGLAPERLEAGHDSGKGQSQEAPAKAAERS